MKLLAMNELETATVLLFLFNLTCLLLRVLVPDRPLQPGENA